MPHLIPLAPRPPCRSALPKVTVTATATVTATTATVTVRDNNSDQTFDCNSNSRESERDGARTQNQEKTREDNLSLSVSLNASQPANVLFYCEVKPINNTTLSALQRKDQTVFFATGHCPHIAALGVRSQFHDVKYGGCARAHSHVQTHARTTTVRHIHVHVHIHATPYSTVQLGKAVRTDANSNLFLVSERARALHAILVPSDWLNLCLSLQFLLFPQTYR